MMLLRQILPSSRKRAKSAQLDGLKKAGLADE